MFVLALCGPLGAVGISGLASGLIGTDGLLSVEDCFTGSGV